jgi:hypothetical protein
MTDENSDSIDTVVEEPIQEQDNKYDKAIMIFNN